MPAFVYRGPFQVASGETLKYGEVAADGTVGPVITRTVTKTLRFFARDLAGNSEDPQSITYTIIAPKPPPISIVKGRIKSKAR